LFEYARLRRLAEDVGVISIDKTPDGIAIKFSEKARTSPELLAAFIREHKGATFTPSGLLRIVLTEDELDEVLAAARQSLLQLWVTD
jgi:transcription-repair coupling factor (superfamily II helicase)